MNFSMLNELDKKILEITGYGATRGFGRKPALIIIDAQKKFVGLDKPILESMDVYPLSIGEKAWRATEKIKTLLDAARVRKVPVFYSTSSVPLEESPFNSFAKKRIRHETSKKIPADQEDIMEIIKPAKENEWVFHKRYASGFFATPLMTFLNTLGCDTLIVTGFVTSGCVRAFAVDGASYNFNVAVVEDCVGDRFGFAHDLSLIDMHLKYADVIPADEALKYLNDH